MLGSMLGSMLVPAQDLRDKTVAITGASAGIGRATALKFAKEGAAVALLAREPDALGLLKVEIESLGGRALAVPVDVADADAVFAAALRIERELGAIDVWINDAMVTVFSPVAELSPDEFHRVTAVTYHGAVHGTMAALRHMRPRNRGTIVQIGSVLAYRGIPLQAAYCGAKYALRGFTDSLRTELLRENSRIRITMLHIPAVNTPQFDWARTHMKSPPRPVAPVFEPEAVAEKVYQAARRPFREYWAGGSAIMAILGNMLLPGVFDRYLAYFAWSGQLRDYKISRSRQDNLYTPVERMHRARGSFGREARPRLRAFPGPILRIGAAALACGVVVGLTRLALHRTEPHHRAVMQRKRLR